MIRIALACLLVGCSAGGNAMHNPDAPQALDATGGCSVQLSFDPAMPFADAFSQIRASAAIFGGGGVFDYTWTVTDPSFNPVTTMFEAADHSQIGFIAPVAGIYNVSVSVSGPESCEPASVQLNVQAPGANIADYRLRVVPLPSLAPPYETVIQVHGGADYNRPIVLDPGITLAGSVKSGTTGISAYLRFMPASAPNAAVETFSASDGSFSVRLLGESHDVLIVPAVAGLAPRIVTWSPGTTTLAINAGNATSGTVKDSGNVAIAGAKVQLSSGGVPSTLATTDASGNFTVHTSFAAGAQVTVDVTPPAGRGLSRLTATSAFDLTQPLAVKYASLATCDLAATPVKRGTSALPGVNVTLVGQLAAIAGTIAAANATGTVRIAASTDGTGKLPSTLAPRAALSAVVDVAPGDVAVASLDLATSCTQTISAPAMVGASGTTAGSTSTLPNIQIEATPTAGTALGLAGAQPVLASSDGNGAFNFALASGGFYDVRFVDPAGNAAPLVVLDVGAAGVPSAATLPVALRVTGDVSVSGNANPVIGASVQILCVTCTGIDAARPIAETATDARSSFRVAVPDPGAM